eukprot:scaffold11470_cov78-Skeletonema_marinoi.AAC.1
MKVTVIGLGAMGGGMARSLIRSNTISEVSGFDLSTQLVQSFYDEAHAAGKSTPSLSSELTVENFVDETTDVVLIVLVNEAQCQSVCDKLLSIMREGSCVVVSSTVSAAWSKTTEAKFSEKNIQFCDCPISGGSVRALNGEITIMASGEPKSL